MFGSIQNLGPRQPNQYKRYPFAHARGHGTATACCAQNVSSIYCDVKPPSHNALFCARSVGPFGPLQEEKRGQTHVLPLLRKRFFSGCMESVRCPQPIRINSSGKKYSIRFVPVLLGGGLRCALTRYYTDTKVTIPILYRYQGY